MPTTRVRDLDMYYEDSARGEPVVYISGITADHLIWKPFQLPAFTQAGYRCLIFDNRDVGRTGESGRGDYTTADFAEDTFGLMDKVGIESAHVVGYSMGGMIAQEMTLARPQRVRSLTLLATAPRPDAYLTALLRSLIPAKRHLTREDFTWTLGLRVFTHRFFANPEAVKAWQDRVLGHPYPQSADSFVRQAEAVLQHDSLDRLGAIRVPTHVMVGDEDILVPPRHSRILAERIAGARLTEISEAGHVPFMEKAAEFNRSVLEFISRH